jgi:hypothetical protein
MPNEYLLTEFVDEAAVEKQTAILFASFDKIEARAKEVATSLRDTMSKIEAPNFNAKETVDQLQKMDAVTKTYATDAKVLSDNLKTQQEVLAKYGKTVQDVNKSLEENIQTRNRLKNSMESYLKDQKEDAELLRKGTINRTEYNKRVTESTVKIEQYKNKIKEIDVEIQKQTQTEKQRAIEAEKAAKKEQKALELIENEYKQLTLAYNEASMRAKNLALLSPGSKAAKEAAEEANKLGDVLKKVDSSVGQNQRNVGNYAGSLGGYFNKIFGQLRTLANIIPGLGLGGIFLIAFETIQKAVQSLGLFNSRLSDTKRQTELLNSVTKERNEIAGKEIATLEILYSIATNNNIALSKRKEAVDELQKQYPDYFKNIDQEIILQGKAKSAYNDAKQAILEKAKAQAIEGELSKLATKELETQQKLKEYNDKKDKVIAERKAIDKKKTTDKEGKGLDQFFVISELTSINKDIDDSNKDLAEISKDREFLLSKITAPPKKTNDKTDKNNVVTKESTKQLLDADFEIYKINQNRKIKLLGEEVDNEKNNYEKRISYLHEFSTAKLELIDKEKDQQLKKLNEQEEVLQANLKKSKGTERNNILAEIKNINAERKILEAKYNDDRLNTSSENEKKYTAIIDQQGEERLKIQRQQYQRALTLIDNQRDQGQAKLDEDYKNALDGLKLRFDKGQITEKEYVKKRLRLEFDYKIASVQNEIDRAKKILAVRALLGQDVSKELAALAALEKTVAKESADFIISQEKNKRKAILETFATIKNVADETFGLISGLLNAKLISEKNAIREQQDAAEAKAQRDIEIVNASTDAEEKKAARILIINARLAAQKEQFQRRERQAELDKARFDKAIAIFNIILSTAAAVIKALPNIPLSIGVAALGAAKLAIAIATPIPKFFKGKKKGEKVNGGVGMVNDNPDGITTEIIEKADGSLHIPKGRNVLTFLNDSDTVHPDADQYVKSLNGSISKDLARQTMESIAQERSLNKEMLKAFQQQTHILEQIKDKPVLHQTATREGLVNMFMSSSRWTTFVEQETNW